MKKLILFGLIFACLFLFLNSEAQAYRSHSFGFSFGFDHPYRDHPYWYGPSHPFSGYHRPYGHDPYMMPRLHGSPGPYYRGGYRIWTPGRWVTLWDEYCRCWRQAWIPGQQMWMDPWLWKTLFTSKFSPWREFFYPVTSRKPLSLGKGWMESKKRELLE